jgi:hypothetical protein
MKKACFGLFTIAIVFLGSQAFAQTIHRDQLGDFWGVVSAELSRKTGTVLSQGFEEWSLGQLANEKRPGRINYRRGGEFPLYVAYQPLRSPAYVVPRRTIVVIALQDVFGGERKNNVLSFWKADGDSLKFVFFDTKVRLGNIGGSLIVRDVAVVSENKFLVVTEHHVTDHGVGGSYEFASFDFATHEVNHLYSDRYWAEANASTGDTLRYDLTEGNGLLEARMIREHLSFSLVETKLGIRRTREVTGTDTTVVPLMSTICE